MIGNLPGRLRDPIGWLDVVIFYSLLMILTGFGVQIGILSERDQLYFSSTLLANLVGFLIGLLFPLFLLYSVLKSEWNFGKGPAILHSSLKFIIAIMSFVAFQLIKIYVFNAVTGVELLLGLPQGERYSEMHGSSVLIIICSVILIILVFLRYLLDRDVAGSQNIEEVGK